MPRHSRYEHERSRETGPYGGRRSSEAHRPDEDDRYQNRDDWEDRQTVAGFQDRQSNYYDRSGRDTPRTFQENERRRDRADRLDLTYDDDYRGRIAGGHEGRQNSGSGLDWRGSDGVTLPAGPSAYRHEQRGYNQVHRGKGPKDYQRSDDRIREDVCDRLSDEGSLDASEITVRVEKGEVTLDGEVDSRRAKRMAEDCVEDVSGVRHCQNNLRVKQAGTTATPAGDGSSRKSKQS